MSNPLKLMMGTAGVAGGPEGDPGELWTWGRNTYGMNGDRPFPTPIMCHLFLKHDSLLRKQTV